MMKPECIVIGASAGGVLALQKIFSELHAQFAIPIVVVQHIPAKMPMQVGSGYRRFTHLRIFEAEDKMPIEKQTVYFAPPGYHLMVEREKIFSLSLDEPVHFSRPSIDVLFQSAAWALGPRAMGILLTGANSDGADGLFEIQKAKGFAVVQDPEEAEVKMMPKSALKLFAPDRVMNLAEIALFLNDVDRKVKSVEDENPNSR